MKLINFGHKMSEAAIKKAAELLGKEIAYIEHKMVLSFDSSIEDQLYNIVNQVSHYCEDDNYAIALPGASILTAGVLATLSGLSGVMPRVIMMAQVDGAFMPTEVIDMQKIKTSSRVKRDKDAIKLA
jgi:hypothetical protein